MDKNQRVKILLIVIALAIAALAWYFLKSGGSTDATGGIEVKGGTDTKDYRLDTEIFTNDTYNNLQNLGDSAKAGIIPGNKNPFEEGYR